MHGGVKMLPNLAGFPSSLSQRMHRCLRLQKRRVNFMTNENKSFEKDSEPMPGK